jgi:XTP/dITP diphosphohydrolase
VRGEWPGQIVREVRGAGGFGYDPVFLPEGESQSAAEMSPERKDSLSHRRRAFEAIAPQLQRVLSEA